MVDNGDKIDLEKKAEAERILSGAVKNFDWEAHCRRVVWSLNEPPCCCQSCYDSWLEWGKKLYGNNMPVYEERKAEALLHLKNKLNSRRLDEERRAREREQRYSRCVA